MIFTDAALEAVFNPEFLTYLRQHPFAANAQSDTELRFHYLSRQPFLMEGKNTIGNIDLIMRNKETGNTLLIEAKNHTLPLDVYFVSPAAIKSHVACS